MLCQEPHTIGEPRKRYLAIVIKFHVVFVFPFLAETVFVVAEETLLDDILRGIHVGFFGNNLRDF